MKEIKVNEDNVVECWKWYELYMDKFRQEHYSDANYEDFVTWCEDELGECPSCGQIVWKDEQEHLDLPDNPDNVCDWCMEELDYGK